MPRNNIPFLAFSSSSVLSLSCFQSADNRVPTPASTASADLHTQHAVPELPAVNEPKVEPKQEEPDFESCAAEIEPKMEVGVCWFRMFSSGNNLIENRWINKHKNVCVHYFKRSYRDLMKVNKMIRFLKLKCLS